MRPRGQRGPLYGLLSSRMKLPTFVICLLLVLYAPDSQAYIDPNAGGLLFQILTPVFAAIVGAWLFLRRWIAETLRRLWQRLRGKSTQ